MKNSLFVATFSLINSIATYVTLVAVANSQSNNDYVAFFAFWSLYFTFAALLSGIEIETTRQTSRQKYLIFETDEIIHKNSRLLPILFFWILGIGLTVYLLSQQQVQSGFASFLLISIGLFFAAFGNFVRGYLLGSDRSKAFSLGLLVEAMLRITTLSILIFVIDLPISGLSSVILTISAGSAFVFFFPWILKKKTAEDVIKRLKFKSIFYPGLTTVIIAVNSAGLIWIIDITNENIDTKAVISSALIFTRLPIFVFSLFAPYLLPSILKLNHHNIKPKFKQLKSSWIFLGGALISLPATILLYGIYFTTISTHAKLDFINFYLLVYASVLSSASLYLTLQLQAITKDLPAFICWVVVSLLVGVAMLFSNSAHNIVLTIFLSNLFLMILLKALTDKYLKI